MIMINASFAGVLGVASFTRAQRGAPSPALEANRTSDGEEPWVILAEAPPYVVLQAGVLVGGLLDEV